MGNHSTSLKTPVPRSQDQSQGQGGDCCSKSNPNVDPPLRVGTPAFPCSCPWCCPSQGVTESCVALRTQAPQSPEKTRGAAPPRGGLRGRLSEMTRPRHGTLLLTLPKRLPRPLPPLSGRAGGRNRPSRGWEGGSPTAEQGLRLNDPRATAALALVSVSSSVRVRTLDLPISAGKASGSQGLPPRLLT